MNAHNECKNFAFIENEGSGSELNSDRAEAVELVDFQNKILKIFKSSQNSGHFTPLPEVGIEYDFDVSLLTEDDADMWEKLQKLTIEECQKYRQRIKDDRDNGLDKAGEDETEIEKVKRIFSSRMMFFSYLAKQVTLNTN